MAILPIHPQLELELFRGYGLARRYPGVLMRDMCARRKRVSALGNVIKV